jgi:hypothetical protein
MSESFAANMFAAPNIPALVIILPILGVLSLCCICFVLCGRRYRRRRRNGDYYTLE